MFVNSRYVPLIKPIEVSKAGGVEKIYRLNEEVGVFLFRKMLILFVDVLS